MTIPSVMRGLIETEDGKVFELDSPKGVAWLEAIGSFRFEPTGDSKAYTVRKEPSGYWYGCRKIAGTVRKKYIGKTSEISTAKLDEIAVDLENSLPPVSRSKKVAQVAEGVAEVAEVAEKVAQVEQDRLATLESQMAMVLQAVEALQEAMPGKSDAGDSMELPKVDNEVVERLQNELSNLQTENEELRSKLKSEEARLVATAQCYREMEDESREEAYAEKSKLEQELEALQEELIEARSQLEEEQARLKELDDQCDDYEKWWKEEEGKVADRDKIIAELRSTTARELPDAYDLLNRVKAKYPKTKVTPGDVEKILEILEES